MKNKQQKVMFIVFTIFRLGVMIVGLGLIIHAYALYKGGSDFRQTEIKTEATITRIETYTARDSDGNTVTGHRAYVSFFVNGREYAGSLDYYYPAMREGETTKILYQADNPQDFRSVIGVNDVFGWAVAGLVFFLAGFTKLLRQNKKSRLKRALISNGRVLTAAVEDIIIGNASVNDSPCKNIICSYKDDLTGNTYVFKSENIWREVPQGNTAQLPSIDVYVDRDDFSKNYVDIDNWFNAVDASAVSGRYQYK